GARGDLSGAAHHLLEGSDPISHGQVERAAGIAREASLEALGRLAFESTSELATRALLAIEEAEAARKQKLLSESETTTKRPVASRDDGTVNAHPGVLAALACELEVIRAEARIRGGESTSGKAGCVRAAALARKIGSPALEARAALAYGTELTSGRIDPKMI